MKKALISQKYEGKSSEDVIKERKQAMEALREQGFEPVFGNFYDEFNEMKRKNPNPKCQHPELHYLSERLKIMSECSAVYFCKGWEYDYQCRMEHEASLMYGLRTLYAD